MPVFLSAWQLAEALRLEIHRDEFLIAEPTRAPTCAPPTHLGVVVGAAVAEHAADTLGSPGRSSESLQYMLGR
jgi:hypothetical protein